MAQPEEGIRLGQDWCANARDLFVIRHQAAAVEVFRSGGGQG
jgi:hypothetical protein